METRELRTAAANKARMRASEEKFADRLRDRGWICLAPDSEMATAVREEFGFWSPEREA